MGGSRSKPDDISGGLANVAARLTRAVRTASSIAIVASVLIAIVSTFALYRSLQLSRAVTQAHIRIESLEAVRSATFAAIVWRAPSIARSNDASGEPLAALPEQVAAQLAALRRVGAGDAAERAALDDLAARASQLFDAASQLAPPPSENASAAGSNAVGGHLARTIDDLNGSLNRLEARENAAVESASRELRRLCEAAIGGVVIVLLSGLGALGSARRAISGALRKTHESIGAEAQRGQTLRELNETLEERLAERTARAEERARAVAAAQSELRRHLALLEALGNSMGDAVLVCDQQLHLIAANLAAEQLIGPECIRRPLDEWPSQFELLEKPDGKPIARRDWPLLHATRGEELSRELVMRNAAGTRFIDGYTGPVRDESGAIVGALMIFRDVTENRNRVREARRAAQFADAQRLKVLVVEENPVNLRLALLQVRKLGFRVDGAPAISEALELSRDQPYQLILIDCDSAPQQARNAIVELRNRGAGRNPALIATVAEDDPELREQWLAAGCDGCLLKPLNLELLRATLDQHAVAPARAAEATDFEQHPSVDPTPLAELRALGENGRDEVGEIVGLFLEDLPARLARIGDAVRTAQFDQSAALAHGLRSACTAIGAVRLAVICEHLEAAARDHRPPASSLIAQANDEAANLVALLAPADRAAVA